MRTHFSKLWLSVSLFLLVALALSAEFSCKYVWLYVTRKADPPPVLANLLNDPRTSNNPEVLLEEANRLSWVFNWPKASPLYARAEELFRATIETKYMPVSVAFAGHTENPATDDGVDDEPCHRPAA